MTHELIIFYILAPLLAPALFWFVIILCELIEDIRNDRR